MKKLNRHRFYLFLLILSLSACQSVKDGLTGAKRSTSDEFLVEKKNPLVLPPEFGELPLPNTIVDSDQDNNSDDEVDLRVILGKGKTLIKTDSKKQTTNNSLEKSIIEKIKNN